VIFLDTNIVIRFNKRNNPLLVERIMAAYDEGQHLALPVIALLELEVGARRSAWPDAARSRLDKFLTIIAVIPLFEEADALAAAELKSRLERQGEIIGAHDLLIAAQVLRRDALLVTSNTREFSRVPGLKLEDWTRP
jgi:tRNA(fMet)-specific endonuclease VapC